MLRELWTTGRVTFNGRYFDYEDVGFYSGTEMGPLHARPAAAADLGRLQPAAEGRRAARDVMQRRIEAACRRILRTATAG